MSDSSECMDLPLYPYELWATARLFHSLQNGYYTYRNSRFALNIEPLSFDMWVVTRALDSRSIRHGMALEYLSRSDR